MTPRSKRILIWSIAATGFVGALIGAAFLGIAMAKHDLPEAGKLQGQYPVLVIVTVGGEKDPVFLAQEIQSLRDFWFTYPTPEERRDAEDGSGGVRKLEGAIEVRTLQQDADVVEVDILTGTANGKTGWIHLSQLPPQP